DALGEADHRADAAGQDGDQDPQQAAGDVAEHEAVDAEAAEHDAEHAAQHPLALDPWSAVGPAHVPRAVSRLRPIAKASTTPSAVSAPVRLRPSADSGPPAPRPDSQRSRW